MTTQTIHADHWLADVIERACALTGSERAEYVDHLVESIEDDRAWLAVQRSEGVTAVVTKHLADKETILVAMAAQR